MGDYIMRNGELYHYGVLGMKWGVRRYQNKDGSLTALGKKHLVDNRIRTEDNLEEKTIPKGTKMYRATPYEKDDASSSVYVTYLDVDRNKYKSGTIVNSYVNKEIGDNSVYEHEFELKEDIHIPSLKTVREIENRILKDAKKRQEIAKAYVEQHMMLDGFTKEDINVLSEVSKRYEKLSTKEDQTKLYRDLAAKYGEDRGDFYFHEAIAMKAAKEWVPMNLYTLEGTFGRAHNTKDSVIKELKKLGYNAMYDNASIGVGVDGKYSKDQEGVEPLIVFDRKSTLHETSVKQVTTEEQRRAQDDYDKWVQNRNKLLRKFK